MGFIFFSLRIIKIYKGVSNNHQNHQIIIIISIDHLHISGPGPPYHTIYYRTPPSIPPTGCWIGKSS